MFKKNEIIWKRHEEYIQKLIEENNSDLTLGELLDKIPYNLMVDLNFQEYYKHPFRYVTIKFCKKELPKSFLDRKISHLKHDLYFDGKGLEYLRPILIIVMPLYHWRQIAWGEDRQNMINPKYRIFK